MTTEPASHIQIIQPATAFPSREDPSPSFLEITDPVPVPRVELIPPTSTSTGENIPIAPLARLPAVLDTKKYPS